MTFPLLDANVTRVYSSSYLYCSFLVTNAWRGMHPYVLQDSYVLDALVNRSPSRFTIIVTMDLNLFCSHYYPRAFLGHQIVFGFFFLFSCKHALQQANDIVMMNNFYWWHSRVFKMGNFLFISCVLTALHKFHYNAHFPVFEILGGKNFFWKRIQSVTQKKTRNVELFYLKIHNK